MTHTILIVDDDPGIGSILTQLLEDEGYAAVYMDTAAGGLAYLATTPPDLILLDYQMPGMNGADFVQEAERQDVRDSIPLILVTASDAAAERAQQACTDDYLGKPFDLEEVLATITRHLPASASS